MNSSLSGVQLNGANLTNANLTNANLTGVDLSNLDLTGIADLRTALLTAGAVEISKGEALSKLERLAKRLPYGWGLDGEDVVAIPKEQEILSRIAYFRRHRSSWDVVAYGLNLEDYRDRRNNLWTARSARRAYRDAGHR